MTHLIFNNNVRLLAYEIFRLVQGSSISHWYLMVLKPKLSDERDLKRLFWVMMVSAVKAGPNI